MMSKACLFKLTKQPKLVHLETGAGVDNVSGFLGLYVDGSVLAWKVTHLQVTFYWNFCIHCLLYSTPVACMLPETFVSFRCKLSEAMLSLSTFLSGSRRSQCAALHGAGLTMLLLFCFWGLW